ncbi:hypothetical protein BFX80_06930 [Cobetia marina]|nr:hypothetical protein BFX80_06930 [Cobetia marina]
MTITQTIRQFIQMPHRCQHLVDTLRQMDGFRCQLGAIVVAAKEQKPDVTLQIGDRRAHRRLRQAKPTRCLGETARAHHFLEDLQLTQVMSEFHDNWALVAGLS